MEPSAHRSCQTATAQLSYNSAFTSICLTRLTWRAIENDQQDVDFCGEWPNSSEGFMSFFFKNLILSSFPQNITFQVDMFKLADWCSNIIWIYCKGTVHPKWKLWDHLAFKSLQICIIFFLPWNEKLGININPLFYTRMVIFIPKLQKELKSTTQAQSWLQNYIILCYIILILQSGAKIAISFMTRVKMLIWQYFATLNIVHIVAVQK